MLGSKDEAADLDSALQQEAVAVLGPEQSSPSTMLYSKGTSSGSVKAVAFLDADVCYWQLAAHHLHKSDVLEASSLPGLGEEGLLPACLSAGLPACLLACGKEAVTGAAGVAGFASTLRKSVWGVGKRGVCMRVWKEGS